MDPKDTPYSARKDIFLLTGGNPFLVSFLAECGVPFLAEHRVSFLASFLKSSSGTPLTFLMSFLLSS